MSQRSWRYISVVAALTACHEAQAPAEVIPAPPAYTTIVIDSQFNADYDHAIRYPTLAVSAGTTLNLLYGLFETAQLRYAGCPIACDERRNWRVGDPDTGTAGDFVGAAVAGQQIHVAFQAWRPSGFPAYLKYGACPGRCDQLSHWTVTEVDTTGNTGWLVSLAADPAAVHIAYLRYANPMQLRYATCTAACGDFNSWSRTIIDTSLVFGETQIVRDAAGALHIVYEVYDSTGFGTPVLRYARCSTTCTLPTSWHTTPIGTGSLPFLTAATNGSVHLAYVDGVGAIRIGQCAAGCSTAGDWQIAPVVSPLVGVTDVALTVTGDGRQHLVYSDRAGGEYGMVRYETCASACADSLSWHRLTIDSTQHGDPYYVAVAVDSTGRPTVAHATSAFLRVTTVIQIPQ